MQRTIPCPRCGEDLICAIEGPDPSVGIFGYAITELVTRDCDHDEELSDILFGDDDRLASQLADELCNQFED